MKTTPVENKVIRLCLYALAGIVRINDHVVYNTISHMCEVCINIYYMETVDREKITSIVIDRLEREGVEVCY